VLRLRLDDWGPIRIYNVRVNGMRLPEHKTVVVNDKGETFLCYTFWCNDAHRATVLQWHEYAEALASGKRMPVPS
jgi:hypothetical protein